MIIIVEIRAHTQAVPRGHARTAGLLFWNNLHEPSNQWHLDPKILPHEPNAAIGR